MVCEGAYTYANLLIICVAGSSNSMLFGFTYTTTVE